MLVSQAEILNLILREIKFHSLELLIIIIMIIITTILIMMMVVMMMMMMMIMIGSVELKLKLTVTA
jgi:hypothetical protein